LRSAALASDIFKVFVSLMPRPSSQAAISSVTGAMNACLQDSSPAKDAAANAGVVQAAVLCLASLMRQRKPGAPLLTDDDSGGTFNSVQLLKTLCSGAGDAAARKSAFVSAGGIDAIDAVLAACDPTNAVVLRSNASFAKLFATSTTIGVGGVTFLTTAVPCSNPGCSAPRLSRCSACGTPYCSAACQRAHWPLHKRECKSLTAKARDGAHGKVLAPLDERLTSEQVRDDVLF
jgi:hypothetical protein